MTAYAAEADGGDARGDGVGVGVDTSELSRAARVAGMVLAVLVMINDIAQSEYDQASFDGLDFTSYYFLCFVTVAMTALLAPLVVAGDWAWYATRGGRGCSWRGYVEGRLLPRLRENPRFSFARYARAAVPLAACNFFSTYAWYMSLSLTPVSVNSPLSRASTLVMVFALSVMFLRERVTSPKVAAVTLCLAGVGVAGYGNYLDDPDGGGHGGTVRGYGLIFGAAVLWAAYETLYRLRIGSANAHGVTLIVSMQGAAVALLFWVGIPAAIGSGLEPSPGLGSARVRAFLAVNAAFAVLYYLLYAMAMSWTSPLFITIVGTLGIPVSGLADYLLHSTYYGPVTLGGMVLVVLGVLAMNAPRDAVPRLLRGRGRGGGKGEGELALLEHEGGGAL